MLSDLWQTSTRKRRADNPSAGPGALRLDDLCALLFEGPDVVRFLQGYLTCDVEKLSDDRWQAAAVCNLQGRVIAFGWARSRAADQIIWLVHGSLVEIVQAAMRPYLAFSKTTLKIFPTDHVLIGIIGPDLPPRIRISDTSTHTPGAGIELLESMDAVEALAANTDRIDRDNWMTALVELRIVWLTQPASGRFLPQMLGITELGAVDFDKGCYLGQEVVARAQHLGKVKRTLTPLYWSGDRPPATGGEIRNTAGREIGTLIQTTTDPHGTRVCLAVLQDQAKPPFLQQDTGLDAIF